jgi:pimeloyl-ACP methyl ester carboxylesterase
VTRLSGTLIAACLALVMAPVAAAKAPLGDAFYTPPQSSLKNKTHGDVIYARPEALTDNLRLDGAARNTLVLYVGQGIDGKPVAVSGTIAVPNRPAPKGGWPIVTWAHGSVGLADQCAPSRVPRRDDTYTSDLRSQFSALLKAGYAVAATDYEGLGTPGVHPYLVGRSEGRSVLDIVRAARKLERGIGKSVAILGHSQGGHAALWAASLAPRYTPELKVRTTIAYAPASHIAEQSNLLYVLKDPSPLSGLIASIFRGVDIANPSLRVSSYLSDKAAALYPQVDVKCLDELYGPDTFAGIAPSEILREGVDIKPLLKAADKSDPENLKIRTPLYVLQGTADSTVLSIFTDPLVNDLKAKGARVTYKKYTGITHGQIVQAARKDARAFLRKRLGR